MTWRVELTREARLPGWHVYVMEYDGIGRIRYLQGDVVRPAEVGEQVEPSFILHDDYARPLFDALAEQFVGNASRRELRADYDAERKRVDSMLETLRMIAVRQP